MLARIYCYSAAQQPLSVSALATALCGCSVSALLPSEKPSEHSRVGELRFIMPEGSEELALQSLSPEKGFGAFMG